MPKRSWVLLIALFAAFGLAYGVVALPRQPAAAEPAAPAEAIVPAEAEVAPPTVASSLAASDPAPPAAPIEMAPNVAPVVVAKAPEAAPSTLGAPQAAATAPAIVPSAPSAPPAQAVATSTTLTALETELFNDHNTIRSQNGLGTLQVDATLVAIARQRAVDMATKGYFSHTQPDGLVVFDLLKAGGYKYAIAAENIARNNYPEAQAMDTAMDAFMNSPGHRTNILEKRFRLVGVGVAVDAEGMKYVAVVFAG